jgi:acetyl-CoA synthetase
MTRCAVIAKTSWRVPPNLPLQRPPFVWGEAKTLLQGLPGGGLNIAHEAVVRQVKRGLGEKTALRLVSARGDVASVSYAELSERMRRFARVLTTLSVAPGEVVCSLLGRQRELYEAVLGTLAGGRVFCPMFAAFGPEPIKTRLQLGNARVLLTTRRQYEKKIRPMRAELEALRAIVLVNDAGSEVVLSDDDVAAGVFCFDTLMNDSEPIADVAETTAETPALLHFTSGTTGKPKGAVHVHGAVLVHECTGRSVLDLHDDDVYWCTADPGWVTGMSYGIIAPLCCGVTSIVDAADFDAERWYRLLSEQKVSVWYTAPTAVRMLMKAGDELPARFDLSSLRFAGSVGEPLNPEAVWWGHEVLGAPFHDNWWQTETGGIMIANTAAMPIKPGSMGVPVPGIEAAIVSVGADGSVVVVTEPDVEGELALRPGWPSMFREYLNDHARYARCFVGGWYLTGDLARRDAEGSYWFVGRADDVIKSAGHLIGPFEVESALMEHASVAEVGVIGLPDAVAGQIVKAFVVLKPGVVSSPALTDELLAWARRRLGPAVAPRELSFVDDLPKTRSGKIMRRLLRARALGLPEGDTSTLEGSAS